jgi:hypothetical protein
MKKLFVVFNRVNCVNNLISIHETLKGANSVVGKFGESKNENVEYEENGLAYIMYGSGPISLNTMYVTDEYTLKT